MKQKYILLLTVLLLSVALTGCDDDKVDTKNSVFGKENLTHLNSFDTWLENNFRIAYNTSIIYKFDYMDSDFNYNLTPVKFLNATKFTQIMKYCWHELYDEMGGMDFTRETAPKQVYLIGSTGYDAVTSTEVLATASGGLRVVIYKLNNINEFSYTNIKDYMYRMNHEFSHILDQKKSKEKTFSSISEQDYVGDNWSSTGVWNTVAAANQVGFVTKYAGSEPDEDFAEVFSKYITLSDNDWNSLLSTAGAYGSEKILLKVSFITDYMKENWDIDFVKLREASLRRAQKAVDMEFLSFSEY